MDIFISLFLIFYVDFIYIETLSEAWMHNIVCKPPRFHYKVVSVLLWGYL